MEVRGGVPNREQMAEEIRQTIEDVYRARYRQTEKRSFDAIKKATDHALEQLQARGFGGIANRLFQEISHEYLMKHRYQRMPALAAFTKAAYEVLGRFAAGEIV